METSYCFHLQPLPFSLDACQTSIGTFVGPEQSNTCDKHTCMQTGAAAQATDAKSEKTSTQTFI